MRWASSSRVRASRRCPCPWPAHVTITIIRTMRRSSRAALSFAERVRSNCLRLRCALILMLAAAAPSVLDAQPHDHEPAAAGATDWQWGVDGNVFFGFNYQVPEVPRLLGVGVAELADGRRHETTRVGHLRRIDHAVSRAVDAQGHRLAAGVSDRRDVPARTAHRLPASTRLDHGPWRPLQGSLASRDLAAVGRPRRVAGIRTDCVHASPVGGRQPPVAIGASLHGLDARDAGRSHRRRHSRRVDGRELVVQGPGTGREPHRSRSRTAGLGTRCGSAGRAARGARRHQEPSSPCPRR